MSGRLDHKGVRYVPDNGMCAYPDCGRRLEAPKAYWPAQKQGDIETVRHMRGSAGRTRTGAPRYSAVSEKLRRHREEVSIGLSSAREQGKALAGMMDAVHDHMEYLENTVHDLEKTTKHLTGVVETQREQLKTLENAVKALESRPVQAQISHKRIKDGGEHARTQRKRQKQANQPPILRLRAVNDV